MPQVYSSLWEPVGMPAGLSDPQRRQLDHWLGDWSVVADHTWPLQDTTVLHVRSGERDLIVKATERSHHLARELAAHREHLAALRDVVPRLVHGSDELQILVATYLPGRLVERDAAEHDPDVYRQAGGILARLLQPLGTSADYVPDLIAKSLRLVEDAAALADPTHLAAARAELERMPRPTVPLHFTHGDYQPRNWLVHEGRVGVIDFGRAAPRHWTSELPRLQHQQFLVDPALEVAFFEGLGRELADVDRVVLRLENFAQALGTIVWAHGIGDSAFEEHGRRMLARLVG
jgi:aminoglycoside phosphotransferase (APT) family kinase protein